ncbi:MAG: Sua5/YciO/YrdC/YwlC family protein [Gammaproteobacteria bacterium]|nr:Sua5/YciO/YrdC/YwlC family protein [Gammaproteobacteria bacterium]
MKGPSRRSLRRAVAALRRGAVIAYPTEGVWGLGCDPRNRRAVKRLLAVKGRPQKKGLLLVAGRFSQSETYVTAWREAAIQERMATLWPGTTLVLPGSCRAPIWLRGRHPGVAVRVSRHPGVVALCRAFHGAIISTSANPAGKVPARSRHQLHRYFGRLVVLPGQLGGARQPSRIVDARSGRVLRS